MADPTVELVELGNVVPGPPAVGRVVVVGAVVVVDELVVVVGAVVVDDELVVVADFGG